MKDNEIGHFPYLPPQNQFDKGGFPRKYLGKDKSGQLKTGKDGQLVWEINWKMLGEVETVPIPIDHPFKSDEPLVDLQSGPMDCYIANLLEWDGETYVYLIGSGWAEQGFPFYDEIFDPKDPYTTGKGCYALIRGVAKDKFIALAKKDCIPDFNDISTGDIKRDFVLPTE